MQTVATIRHGTRDRIPQQNTDKAQEQENPQIAQKKFVTGMAKFGASKIWHEFLNCMAKFGTILLCQISPFQMSPISKFPPSGILCLALGGNLCTARALRATFRLCSPGEPPSTPLGNALRIR